MSRIVTHNETFTGTPTSYDSTNSTIQNASNTGNGLNPVTNTGSNTYATLNGVYNQTLYAFYNFSGTTTIPLNASITSVSCSGRCSVSSSRSNRGYTYLQLASGTTVKGSQVQVTSTATTGAVYSITPGNWNVEELHDIKLRISVNRTSNGTTYNARFRGATLTVNYSWDETIYSISTSSSVQGVGISAQSGETTSGGTNVITITGVGSLSDIKLMDNDVDVTSSLVRSGSNYTYTLSNVNADHTLTVENGLPSYSINVSSTYAGATITANPVSVQEGSSCLLTLTTSDISKVSVVDNGSDITSQFTGSNGTFTYTLTNVITAHTIVVSEVTKKLYMKIDGVMKSVSRIHMKTNNAWTSISFVDFWRKVNGVYVNGEAVSGTTFLMYGGEMESIPEIGTVNKTSSDLTITINDNALESGTYKMFYEDSNRTPLERVDEITEFTIS